MRSLRLVFEFIRREMFGPEQGVLVVVCVAFIGLVVVQLSGNVEAIVVEDGFSNHVEQGMIESDSPVKASDSEVSRIANENLESSFSSSATDSMMVSEPEVLPLSPTVMVTQIPTSTPTESAQKMLSPTPAIGAPEPQPVVSPTPTAEEVLILLPSKVTPTGPDVWLHTDESADLSEEGWDTQKKMVERTVSAADHVLEQMGW